MHTIHKSQVPSKKLTACCQIKQTGNCNNFIKQKLEPYCSAEHISYGGIIILSVGLGGKKRKRPKNFVIFLCFAEIFPTFRNPICLWEELNSSLTDAFSYFLSCKLGVHNMIKTNEPDNKSKGLACCI